MKLFTTLVLICWISCLTNAQEPSIRFQHLTPEDGLSQGHVLCMLQDKEGYIWMGTYYGLNRYNGYSFKLFSKEKNNPKSIISDVVYCLFEDKDGYIWVGTVSGVDVFDKNTETFEHIPIGNNGLSDGYIHAITQDKTGNIWVATNSGGLNKIEYKSRKITQFLNNRNIGSKRLNDLFIDQSNNLWIGSEGKGLIVMNLSSGKIMRMFPENTNFEKVSDIYGGKNGIIWVGNSDGKLISMVNGNKPSFKFHDYLPEDLKTNSIRIRDLAEDINGNILIATNGAGLVLYNPNTEKSKICLHNIYNAQTISSNEAYSLLVDRSWTIFVGTYGRGVSRYSPYNLKFPVKYIETQNENEGDINSYTSCVQDYLGRLIIGSYSGFFIYEKNGDYKHVLPGKTYAENKILNIAIAPDSSIWMGTNRGIHHYDKHLVKIGTYNLLNDNIDHQVYCIYFDHFNNLWFGMFVTEGLFKVPESEWRKKRKPVKYTVYKTDDNDSTSLFGDQVWSIKEDKNKNLWIGTNIGICKYNYSTNNFKRYNITNLCKTIEFDNDNNMWIATRGEGVYYYNLNSQVIKHYTTANGLSQNFVFGVIPDRNKKIWFSSENGLSRFDPITKQFRNYDIYDGLPNNRFDDRSEKLLPNGNIYMGTAKGFTIFNPDEIKDDTSKARVILSSLRIANKNIPYYQVSKGQQIPLGNLHEIELSPDQKDISLGFAALHYSAPHKIKYKYKLEGFDPQWIYTDAKNRIARYTNLDGGKYIFKVIATNGDGVWNNVPLSIDIIINPPFLKTNTFKILAVLFIVSFIILFLRWRIEREHKQNIKLATMVEERTLEISEKNKLLEDHAHILNQTNALLEGKQIDIENQKEELASQRDKLIELNATKDRLFSIIAHDLKNPFNVIIGFSELILSNYHLYTDERRKKMTSQINQASRNAFQLLENLLDWSRSQKGNLIFNPSEVTINELVKTAVFQIKEFAKNKEIKIQVNKYNTESLTVKVDVNMINTVLRNLLSNAVKFSHKNSLINLTLSLQEDNMLKVSVIDSGIGIDPETINNLFKLDKNVTNSGTAGEKGTGLGLLICKDFIEAHQGKIWVESEFGSGTSFHFVIPIA